MISQKFCQVQLTCYNSKEANKIAKRLLDLKLVASIDKVPITSEFNWKNNQGNLKEILLLMYTKVSNFEKIEKEIEKLHSYDTFVLVAVPITKISKKAYKWIKQELNDKA